MQDVREEAGENMIVEFEGLPVSSNHAYFRSNNKRMFMSKEGSAFKEAMAWRAKGFTPLEGDVKATVTLWFADNRRRDAQNYIKLMLDSLEGYCYKDDTQISDLIVLRRRGALPRTKVEIERANGKCD